MSWLSEFTSKAESFLNKIDQGAANSLNESGIVQKLPTEPERHIGEIKISKEKQRFDTHPETVKHAPPITPVKSPNINKYNSVPANLNTEKKTQGNKNNHESGGPTKTSVPSNITKKQDDFLFEFLNSNDPTAVKSHTRHLSGPKTSTPRKSENVPASHPVTSNIQQKITPPIHPQQSSLTKLPEKKNHFDNELEKQTTEKFDVETKVAIQPKDSSVEEKVQQHSTVSNVTKNQEMIADKRISSLELENKLLKNEIHSLNEEIATAIKNLKEQQQETEKYRLRYENRRSQQNEDYERIQKDYESQVNDLTESLQAKDSQLAVLKVRIAEVDTELKEKTITLEKYQNENEWLVKDHSDASGMHSAVLDSLRNKLEETESQLRQEQTEKNSIRMELMNFQNKLQNEKQDYAEAIKHLQSQQHEGRDKTRELEMKIKNAEYLAETCKKELKDYKEKAARILQAKEKLISSLRQGTETSEMSPVYLAELEDVKQERDLLKDELIENKYKMEQLKGECQDLEILHNAESGENDQKIDNLQSSLQDEIHKRNQVEEDMRRYMQELQFTREDLQKHKKFQITQKQEHDSEMKNLRHQLELKSKQTSTSSQEELENRIRTLTDSLIHKQTVVETLNTEKNSLVLQLERLQKQYRDVQVSLTKRKDNHSSDLEDPDSGSRLKPMTSIMPSNITRSKHWKRTATEIDKFSTRLGLFLRRYPIARLMVIFYMFILHLWVTFVLLTYTPETHGPGMQQNLGKQPNS